MTRYGIAFYAVNPNHASRERTWTASAQLTGIVVINGEIADSPIVRGFEPTNNIGRTSSLHFDPTRLAIIDLQVGTMVETTDLLERWFASL